MHVNQLWGVEKYYFFCSFSDVLLMSGVKSLKKVKNEQKKVENGWKKVIGPAFGFAQHPQAGKNTQQERVVERKKE